MFKLPDEFSEEMKKILNDDFNKYLEAFNDGPYRGISINRLKTDSKSILKLLPFKTEKSPFYCDGFYIPQDTEGIGNLALHHAGAFYVQEPSASSAVSLLDVKPGERILDLCAAPGGKSAQIASCLRGKGLIWSNEIIRNRANILLSSFERMGIPNGVVSCCHPDVLRKRLSGYFDKVLVDAPCSGEGMFRKNPKAINEWSREHVAACSKRQLSILNSGAKCVKENGVLVYSTCTFSYEENEGVIEKFLKENSDFEAEDIAIGFGRRAGIKGSVRITPIEKGEGHFAARLRRRSCDNISYNNVKGCGFKNKDIYKEVEKYSLSLFSEC